MKLYKLTDQDGMTQNATQWGEGVTHKARKRPWDTNAPMLCSSDVIHAYSNPTLALLMNPSHGAFEPLRLWEAEGDPVITRPDKLGVFSLTTVRELPLPDWYTSQDDTLKRRIQIRFAVLAARAVLHLFEDKFPEDKSARTAIEWAEQWLSGKTNDETPPTLIAPYNVPSDVANAYWTAYYAAHAISTHPTNLSHYASSGAYTASEADPKLDLAALANEAVTTELSITDPTIGQ